MELNNNLYGKFYNRQVNKGKSSKINEKQKINYAVLASSAVGTLVPMLLIAKKQKTSLFKIGYELKEMLMLGTGSILGGLAGGIIADKGKNTQSKLREGGHQFLANLLLPTTFVAGFLKIAEKSRFLKTSKAIAVIAGVSAGMGIGSFISNKVSKLAFKDCKERKIKPTDVFMHMDDLPIALTLSKVPYVDKILPLAFIYSGYQAGAARGHGHNSQGI
jgi:hypothetical protein